MRWRQAMEQALYGTDGFFTHNRPARHFSTSAQSPLFAAALGRLVVQVDTALDSPSTLDIVDVGAGSGELLTNLLAALPPDVRGRARPIAVEIPAAHPGANAETHREIEWVVEIPGGVRGVLLATEWLDNVPLDLARDGRYLDDGAVLSDEDAAWIARWWPEAAPGSTVEIGRCRDEAWASAVGKVGAGLALAVDYGHFLGTRPVHSTVAGFRDGREVEPLLDGSTDVTCHVAIDSAASAGGMEYTVMSQRQALRELGVDGARPPLSLAHEDPGGYVRALAQASQAATLTDPNGLGGHFWIRQPVATTLWS